ncbi:MAG TPA: ABC transporter permease [Pyrinomonadaceae bacterium]|nr:ABC transporter permease [Pyrinomonadaceae bacterium]
MKKFVAVVKREYFQRVRSRMFIVTTILLPLMMALFGIVPAVVLSINAGDASRIAVVDQTGKLFDRLQSVLVEEQGVEAATGVDNPIRIPSNTSPSTNTANNIILRNVTDNTRPIDDLKADLDKELSAKQIDGYILIPADIMENGGARFFRGNSSDFFISRRLRTALTRVVREQRLLDANVDPRTVRELDRPVGLVATRVSTSGEVRDSAAGLAFVFGIGLIMYISVLLYGQVVLGAVIEEKETRIAEVLFSSVKPFTLMIGKLVGVSFLALTQLAIWGIAIGGLGAYGISVLASRGVPTSIPSLPFVFYIYFVLFFLLGYYVYSTLYALVGSIVTTAQEGGQLAMPIILLLAVGFYLFLPVSRNPDSNFAFWVSLVPFFAPITMLMRIITQTPPFWQIALSLFIGFSTIVLFTWLASKIYRIGMLMYGKRASIPEIVRWLRE